VFILFERLIVSDLFSFKSILFDKFIVSVLFNFRFILLESDTVSEMLSLLSILLLKVIVSDWVNIIVVSTLIESPIIFIPYPSVTGINAAIESCIRFLTLSITLLYSVSKFITLLPGITITPAVVANVISCNSFVLSLSGYLISNIVNHILYSFLSIVY
jgi:hypothetical protein